MNMTFDGLFLQKLLQKIVYTLINSSQKMFLAPGSHCKSKPHDKFSCVIDYINSRNIFC